jgi:5-methylcytosine-specific restriction endonuclease McrA
MAKYTDSLRGYAYEVHQRDNFVCRYCGFDGKQWPNWLCLSVDHLLPNGHPRRDERQYQVTACRFCNEAANRTQRPVDGKSPDQLVQEKKPDVLATREKYKRFWEEYVRSV